jgi:SAM-dependent methyltransferase
MDLPGLGTVGSAGWDLRDTIDDYLGRFDFAGLRCMDLGSSSGYLTFEMERRGAHEVVSVDIDAERYTWDIVPFEGLDMEAARGESLRQIRATQDAYWFAHQLLGSRAKAWHGTGYDLPAELGQFDVVLIGMMLPHVREPFRVLEQAAARSDDTIIVTQPAPGVEQAYAYFMPDAATRAPPAAWWSMSETCVARMLAVLGFEVVSRVRAEHACRVRGDRESCTAMISKRVKRRQP